LIGRPFCDPKTYPDADGPAIARPNPAGMAAALAIAVPTAIWYYPDETVLHGHIWASSRKLGCDPALSS
jgi:hypothetical protein